MVATAVWPRVGIDPQPLPTRSRSKFVQQTWPTVGVGQFLYPRSSILSHKRTLQGTAVAPLAQCTMRVPQVGRGYHFQFVGFSPLDRVDPTNKYQLLAVAWKGHKSRKYPITASTLAKTPPAQTPQPKNGRGLHTQFDGRFKLRLNCVSPVWFGVGLVAGRPREAPPCGETWRGLFSFINLSLRVVGTRPTVRLWRRGKARLSREPKPIGFEK